MKHCTKCGAQLNDDANFCHACGAQEVSVPSQTTTYTQNSDDSEQRSFLNTFYNMLKWERNFWMICAIIFLVDAIIFFIAGIGLFFSGIAAIELTNDDLPATFSVVGILYVFIGIFIYLVISIINFVMTKKARTYRDMVNYDLETVVKRCGSIGLIVVGALFNGPVLIFIIINFVRTKTNKKLIEQIINKQKTGV